MKLAKYLETHKIPRVKFADRIGVSAGAITGYCDETLWPKRPVMEKIVRETAGAVTPNDFLPEQPLEAAG